MDVLGICLDRNTVGFLTGSTENRNDQPAARQSGRVTSRTLVCGRLGVTVGHDLAAVRKRVRLSQSGQGAEPGSGVPALNMCVDSMLGTLGAA